MLSKETGEAGYVNNFFDVEPTVDRSLDTRLKMLPTDFMGKATRGAGAGGPNDPLQAYSNDMPTVLHVNNTWRRTFDDNRGRALDAALLSSGIVRTHDRQIGPLHPMDYEPDPSVGHRQVDRPEYTTALFEDRFNKTSAPSQMAKRNSMLPGPADADSGFRRTRNYTPVLFAPRPIMRQNPHAALRALPTREVQASTMSGMGKSDNALLRIDPFHGTREKTNLSNLKALPDNLPDPRAVRRDKSTHSNALVSWLDRQQRMGSVLNSTRVSDNALPEDRRFYDYYGVGEPDPEADDIEGEALIGRGAQPVGALYDPVGSDYDLVPTGRSKSAGVGSGAATVHTSIPTHIPVRKPQANTSRYKHTNMMDAQRVFGIGGSWGFDTPVRASVNRGNSELVRHDNRRFVGGYERPAGTEGLSDFMLNGTSTRGKDFRGGRGNSVYEGMRQPTGTHSQSTTQRAPIGVFGSTKRQLPMDTVVGTRGGELWTRTQMLTNPFATRHEAYYDLANRTDINRAGDQPAPDTMHNYPVRGGPFGLNPPAAHPGTSAYGDHPKTVSKQLALRI